MKKVVFLSVAILLVILLFSGCADVEQIQECKVGHTYGFWGGLWHGMIAPFAFIGSWFSDDIAVWAINNNGGWYTFGFILGIGGAASSSTSAARRKR